MSSCRNMLAVGLHIATPRADPASCGHVLDGMAGEVFTFPKCCLPGSITVPPSVNAKTAQEHDHPSKAHRRSHARRTAVERSNSRVKNPASIDVAKGWCRLMGLVPISLFFACALVVRNLAISDAITERALAEQQRRRSAGLAPRTRRRRRRSFAELLNATTNTPSQSSRLRSSGTGAVPARVSHVPGPSRELQAQRLARATHPDVKITKVKREDLCAPPAGLEPATRGLGNRCSVP